MISKNFKACVRFEKLLFKDELTDREIEFILSHQETCALNIHTSQALERMHGLPEGTLQIKEDKTLLGETKSVRKIESEARISIFNSTPSQFPKRTENLNVFAAARQMGTLTRRSFIVGLSCGLGAFATTSVIASPEVAWLSAGLFPKYKELLERSKTGDIHSRDHLEILAHLLKPEGDIAYSIPKSHPGIPLEQLDPEWKRFGLPHNQAAVAAFRTLDKRSPVSRDVDGEELEIFPTQHLVVSGSPVTEGEPLLYLPYRQSEETYITSNTYRPERIPYHFVMDREERIKVHSATLHGQEKKSRPHGLQQSAFGKLWRPREYTDDRDFLKTDFLLVSRLPRNREGGEVVILAGAHGVGSGAFALLFEKNGFPTSQLLELLKILEGEPYFQFVLECSVTHDAGITKASKVWICEDCPPQIIKYSDDLFLVDADKEGGKK